MFMFLFLYTLMLPALACQATPSRKAGWSAALVIEGKRKFRPGSAQNTLRELGPTGMLLAPDSGEMLAVVFVAMIIPC